MKLTAPAVFAIAGVAALGYVAWRASRAASGAADSLTRAGAAVVDAVNPFSETNIAYRGVNAAGAAVTGDADWNLGARIFEWANPDAVQREWEAVHGPRNTGGATGSWEPEAPADPFAVPGLPPYFGA